MKLRFEWDRKKAVSNMLKHGVSFPEASTVFGDPNSWTIPDPAHSSVEDRFVVLGRSYRAKLMVVVFTERGENIRIISARSANRKERETYEKSL